MDNMLDWQKIRPTQEPRRCSVPQGPRAAKMTMTQFIEKYGTRTAGLMINAVVERAEEQILPEEATAFREMAGDLTAALEDFAKNER